MRPIANPTALEDTPHASKKATRFSRVIYKSPSPTCVNLFVSTIVFRTRREHASILSKNCYGVTMDTSVMIEGRRVREGWRLTNWRWMLMTPVFELDRRKPQVSPKSQRERQQKPTPNREWARSVIGTPSANIIPILYAPRSMKDKIVARSWQPHIVGHSRPSPSRISRTSDT